MRFLLALTSCLLLSGCIVLQPRAENPFPNMNTIAVVPFFNQSAMPGEINDLGRTFGQAYASELQKIQGYDVLPLGVVETAIIENRLQFRDEHDVLRLAKILDVDAVVVGTITTYNPWYPPEIGMKVNWYSTKNWTILPDGEPCGPCEDFELDEEGECPCGHYDLPGLLTKEGNSFIRGQSPAGSFNDRAEPLFGFEGNQSATYAQGGSTANRPMTAMPPQQSPPARIPIATPRYPQQPVEETADPPLITESPIQLLHPIAHFPLGDDPAQYGPITRETTQAVALANQVPIEVLQETTPVIQASADNDVPQQLPLLAPPVEETPPPVESPPRRKETVALEPVPMPQEMLPLPGTFVEVERDHTKPVMSYTEMFDGKNEEIVELLRDYVELQGDKRSGGWEGYMQRTDDYIEFCCHMMIVDMLSLHGGALRTKVWLKLRKNP